jgi:hypothetical protein
MKVSQIISEDTSIQEDPMGLLGRAVNRVGKYFGSAASAGRLDVGKEANRLSADLKKWMAGSGIKRGQLTADDLEQFLKSSGYTGATVELERLRKERAAGSDRRQAMARRAGQVVGAAGSAAKAGVRTAADTYRSRMARNESITEADTTPLTSAEIDKVLKAVVSSAYKSNTGARRGRFAAQPADPKPTGAPALGGQTRTAPPNQPPAAGGKLKLPPEVVAALSNMSDADRQKLAAALTGGKKAPAPKPAPASTGQPPAPKPARSRAAPNTAPGPLGRRGLL